MINPFAIAFKKSNIKGIHRYRFTSVVIEFKITMILRKFIYANVAKIEIRNSEISLFTASFMKVKNDCIAPPSLLPLQMLYN